MCDGFSEFPEIAVSEGDYQLSERVPEKILQRHINELGVSVRSRHCLMRYHIFTVAELVQKTDSELLRMRGFGRVSLNEVKDRLSEYGLFPGMILAETGSNISASNVPAKSVNTLLKIG